MSEEREFDPEYLASLTLEELTELVLMHMHILEAFYPVRLRPFDSGLPNTGLEFIPKIGQLLLVPARLNLSQPHDVFRLPVDQRDKLVFRTREG